MDKLKVLEETQISPPPGSVPPTSLPCTYFDLSFLYTFPVKFLFFYRSPPEPKTILPTLKHSLSLALKHYYPLAGNLKWPKHSTKPELAYNDGDSVAFTVAEYGYDFDELLSTRAQDLDVLVPLFARFRDINTSTKEKLVPLTAFQVTFLGDKGICIGIIFSHIVSDGNTSFSFIKAWSSLHTSCTSSVKDFHLPFYDRSSIFKRLEKNEAALLEQLKESNVSSDTFHTVINSGNVVPKDLVYASFIMNRNQIERLEKQVSAEIDRQKTPRLYLSSFSVTCAYAWVCFTKTRREGHRVEATEHLFFPVDMRTRLESPVPITYFGNCGVSIEVMAKRSELLGRQGIVIAAELIGKAIHSIDVSGELEKDVLYYTSLPQDQILGLGSSPKFRAYHIDFGWGRPKRFFSNPLETPDLFFNDSPNDEGGIEIGFVGERSQVDAFAYAFATSLGSHVARSMM